MILSADDIFAQNAHCESLPALIRFSISRLSLGGVCEGRVPFGRLPN